MFLDPSSLEHSGPLNTDTIFARLLNFSHYYCTLFAMILVKLNHLSKWKVTDDITVQYKERLIIFTKNIPGKSKRSSSPKWFLLMGKSDGNTQACSFNLHLLLQLVSLVTDSQHHMADPTVHQSLY